MESELKPCPFCGCKEVGMFNPADEYTGEDIKIQWFIYCPNCVIETGIYSDKKFLRDLWNRRASDGTAK